MTIISLTVVPIGNAPKKGIFASLEEKIDSDSRNQIITPPEGYARSYDTTEKGVEAIRNGIPYDQMIEGVHYIIKFVPIVPERVQWVYKNRGDGLANER